MNIKLNDSRIPSLKPNSESGLSFGLKLELKQADEVIKYISSL